MISNKYDIAVIGGSLGGVRAAISAAKRGKKVLLTEETDWVGGQLTSQAVPADEHKWIEKCGATESYRNFRKTVVNHYRGLSNVKQELKEKEFFNPGAAWVSRISHEPLVSLKILTDELSLYDNIDIMYFMRPVSAEVDSGKILSVTLKNLKTDEKTQVFADMFLDATDCGDLLPLTGTDYATGAESKLETNEPHAPEKADPFDMQPITWVFALEYTGETRYPMEKPKDYDYFKSLDVSYDDNKLFSWYGADAETRKKVGFSMFNGDLKQGSLGLWEYRRIVAQEVYNSPITEVSLINWPQNDYNLGNIYEDKNYEKHLAEAQAQSLCFAYWLYTDAPRIDGGKGYNVRLAKDVLGTENGLAKYPYIRESRRIKAVTTIVEQDVAKSCNSGIKRREDSVGVGHYAIDIHLTTKSGTFFYSPTYPFEIPIGAMIPRKTKNLIPSCKNLGATHLTNGCLRLHPVEWNVGEVAGYLAAFCLDKNILPMDMTKKENIKEFQKLIQSNGVEIHWPSEEELGIK